MQISYRPLWHLLLDRNMNKQKLKELTGLSSSSIAKLGKGESVTTDALVRICRKLFSIAATRASVGMMTGSPSGTG